MIVVIVVLNIVLNVVLTVVLRSVFIVYSRSGVSGLVTDPSFALKSRAALSCLL